MPGTVVITQSNYIPWRGWFDMIARADLLVLLDEVQYTRRDWRNRNRIKTAQGLKWLTVPVQSKGKYEQRIDETLVTDKGWAQSHWSMIEQAYRGAAAFDETGPWLRELYDRAGELDRLSDVNRLFIEAIAERLGIDTPVRWSTELESADGPTERLVALSRSAGAERYLSGPAAQAYLDVAQFEAVGIAVDWMTYPDYPEYPQPHGEFAPQVSVVDLLLNAGERAPELLRAPR